MTAAAFIVFMTAASRTTARRIFSVVPADSGLLAGQSGTDDGNGSIAIPFAFGPGDQFKGTALLSYSITHKVTKPGY